MDALDPEFDILAELLRLEELQGEQINVQNITLPPIAPIINVQDPEAAEILATSASKSKKERDKLKLTDPASKTIVYSTLLGQLEQSDPAAYVAMQRLNSNNIDKVLSKHLDVMYDPSESVDEMTIPNFHYVDVVKYKLKTDVFYQDPEHIYYDSDNIVVLRKELIPNITNIYELVQPLLPKDFPIGNFGVWRIMTLKQIFVDQRVCFDRYLFGNIDGQPVLYIRCIQVDEFERRIQQYKRLALQHLDLTGAKVVHNGNMTLLKSLYGSAKTRQVFAKNCKTIHIIPTSDVAYVYLNFEHPWLTALHAALCNLQSSLNRDFDFITTNYAITYLMQLPKEITMFSLRPWLLLQRIDGLPMCVNPKRRSPTARYLEKRKCNAQHCYCFNPFKLDARNVSHLLQGSFASYIRVASDQEDEKQKTDPQSITPLSLHFTLEQAVLCPICGLNTTKCPCAEDPEKSLRARGLFNSYIGRVIVILGKPDAMIDVDSTLRVIHTPNLQSFVPMKRRRTYLVVPDGRSVLSFDMQKMRFPTNNLGIVGAYSMPRCIYDHHSYTAPSTDPALYNFLIRNINCLRNVDSLLPRKVLTTLVNNDDQISHIIKRILAYYEKKKLDGRKKTTNKRGITSLIIDAKKSVDEQVDSKRIKTQTTLVYRRSKRPNLASEVVCAASRTEMSINSIVELLEPTTMDIPDNRPHTPPSNIIDTGQDMEDGELPSSPVAIVDDDMEL